MESLFSPYPSARLWAAGLFLVAAAGIAPFLLLRRVRDESSSSASSVLGTLAFGLWAILLVVALVGHWQGEQSSVWLGVVLAAALVVVPLGVTGSALVSQQPWLTCAACALMGLGALALPAGTVGLVLASIALFALLALMTTPLLTTYWSEPLGYAVGGCALFALGGISAAPAGQVLQDGATALAGALETGHLGVAEPWWLLLLLLVPLIVGLSFRSLAGLGPVRRWVAITLRCLLVIFLTLALAEVHLRHTHETVTVLFVWDRSLSVPPEFAGADRDPKKDLRKRRLLQFINDSVAQRGPRRQRDSSGLIVFGRYPRLELPPASVPRFNLQEIESQLDDTYTDISAAVQLALASFPESNGKRIVLISDGNENLGSVEEVGRVAKQNGVEIDIVPINAGRANEDEILVERIEVPPLTDEDSRLPIRILIRSFNPQVVVGKLTLIEESLMLSKEDRPPTPHKVPLLETQVKVRQGLNAFYFQRPPSKKDAYTYTAQFTPLRVEYGGGKVREGLPGDRHENNEASAHVIARGKRTVLLVEGNPGEHQLLIDRLQKTRSSLRVLAVGAGQLPAEAEPLTQFLTRFDSIILGNLPADSLTETQQKVIRSCVHDQGCGLVMIGGGMSYGAGGWQGTEVEKALPVTCDLRSMEIEGKSGLVLIMHASEIAEGNMWQKKIAQLAIEKLSPVDMIGILHFNWDGKGGNNGHTWHIPFQQIGANRARLLRLLDTMNPGDMPDADPSLKMALGALSDPRHKLATRHIIFISDGDHWQPPVGTLTAIKKAGITCTTVCVTSHGQAEYKRMHDVSKLTGGRAYPPRNPDGTYTPLDPKQLPQIYIKETRLISKSFVHDKPFVPVIRGWSGPTEGMPRQLERLHGFVRTSARPGPLVHVPIVKPEEKETFPILAYWHYGLGKSVAFTSDARAPDKTAWDLDWANTAMHAKFWEQVVDWSLRAVESGKNLSMTTEVRDGKVRVTVHARDEKGVPLTDLELRGGVTIPSLKVGEGKPPALTFTQKGVGVYEAEVRAEDRGSYFVNVQAIRRKQVKDKDGKPHTVEEIVDAVRGGVTIPYSPEFAEMESNTSLLERLRDLTGGKSYADDALTLEQAAASGEVFRPAAMRSQSLQSIWFWLVLLTGVGLFFDVAVRRIAIDPAKLAAAAQEGWAQLRGQASAGRGPQFLDRLQSVKAQVGETIKKETATRRFEGGDAPAVAPPPGAGEVPLSPPPAPKPAAPTKPAAKEEGDFASRLLRAKRRAMEERDRDKGNP
ncbi:MAG: VWA domain-containing protein [Gemmataceae bacterium]|nr:VWA domain-containing protein [Gemmataceae bacterium]